VIAGIFLEPHPFEDGAFFFKRDFSLWIRADFCSHSGGGLESIKVDRPFDCG